jgi:hypothetical protein
MLIVGLRVERFEIGDRKCGENVRSYLASGWLSVAAYIIGDGGGA